MMLRLANTLARSRSGTMSASMGLNPALKKVAGTLIAISSQTRAASGRLLNSQGSTATSPYPMRATNRLPHTHGARLALRSKKRAEGIRIKTAISEGTEDSHPISAFDAPRRTAKVALKDAAALSTATQRTSTYKYQMFRSVWSCRVEGRKSDWIALCCPRRSNP